MVINDEGIRISPGLHNLYICVSNKRECSICILNKTHMVTGYICHFLSIQASVAAHQKIVKTFCFFLDQPSHVPTFTKCYWFLRYSIPPAPERPPHCVVLGSVKDPDPRVHKCNEPASYQTSLRGDTQRLFKGHDQLDVSV